MSSAARSDRSRVTTLLPREVRYWADFFRVSQFQLWRAVASVGDDVDAVRTFLAR